MEEDSTSDLQNSREQDPDSDSSPSELRFEVFHGRNGVLKGENGRREKSGLGALQTAGSNAARYKSMSPASLPISRSPCLTIPPGLSPTSLLESPVMLLDLKAEPSPTTGSFSMPLARHFSINSDSASLPRDTTNNSTCDERGSGEFEFKPHTNAGSGSIISSSGHLVSVGSNYHQSNPFVPFQGQYASQKFVSSSSIATESIKAPSDEFTLPVPASVPPVYTVTSSANASAEVANVEPRQRQGSDSGNLPMYSDNTDSKEPKSLVVVDKSSEDGYNWRKYGQKHVKGSEFPRSYYKCTHPNCQVKKQLERSHDGHITEVVYKGSHDHPKPLPGRRSAVGAVLSSQTEELCDGFSSLISAEDKSLNAHGHQAHQIEPISNFELSPVSASEDDIEVVGARSNRNDDDVDDDDDDDPESKRRKIDIGGTDVIPLIKATREPRVVVQTLSEVDILDDGYRWRKYGQKVVKGNPNPRSYYKCTNTGCPVRKHVERASHDPKAVITTYEGKHNHDVPIGRTSSHDATGTMIRNDAIASNRHVSPALNCIPNDDTTKAMMPYCSDRSDDGVVSLDLGVGFSLSPENRSNELQQMPDTQAHGQIEIAGSGCSKLIQATPVPTYYGRLLKEGVDCYGPRETPPSNHPTDRSRQNIGRLVMGP
ncbi:hypothetical protein MRB53_017042 [Persea americana]|uniref:Uncharacterized protein n=1 Tax=Persea americana TaxID=3435 RepID=A0ACC2M4F0_PERAE|nr:hypothetical protein MRB53_017042 [Persea americana]